MPAKQHQNLAGLYFESAPGQKVAFSLKHTEVYAKISGNISRVEVRQSFENPFTKPLEAIYVFPLPDEAAVDSMEIKIGEQIIKGSIKKREEAKQIYQQAKRAGKTAGLLEQERDNIFTQSLANIKPGEQIDVTIRYTDSLKFERGSYEFVFPMVVGPRYIPGMPLDGSGDTDQVPDASRISPPIIPPAFRSGHDIGVRVEIEAGLPISEVHSTSHKIAIEDEGDVVQVCLAGDDTIPNKDLILRYQVSGKTTEATVLTQKDERGSHFAVYLIPAVEYRSDEVVPKDVVFLMDTSGSQMGKPLAQCKELMRQFIEGLNSEDTFTIIDFANTTHQLSEFPLANTPTNRQKAMEYIKRLNANGGTELLNGIKAVMNFPEAAVGRLRSIVLLTDGYIGNDNEVLAEVKRCLKEGNRLYSFGVGSSVNRFLLNRLAEFGRGTCQVVRQDEKPGPVAKKFFRQINNPVLTNIKISCENTKIYPERLPDLFAEQPLVLFGKCEKEAAMLKITGMAAGGMVYEKLLRLNFEGEGNSGIAQLWGRQQIKALMNQMFGGEKKTLVEQVTETALSYQLLSQYTAFVAVSVDVRVGEESVTMQVPVEMPEDVSYTAIVGGFTHFLSGEMGGGISFRSSSVSAPMVDELADNSPLLEPGLPVSSAPSFFENMETLFVGVAKKKSNNKLQVLSVEGLDENSTTSLTNYLQKINIPAGFSGDMVIEIYAENKRVRQVILDDEKSSLDAEEVFEAIKKALLKWQVPEGVAGKVSVVLKIH